MTIKQAAAQARKYAHGCRLHFDAMQVLFEGCHQALGTANPSLEELWAWVDDRLKAE